MRHMQVASAEIEDTELWIHFRDGTTEQEPVLPPLLDT